MIRVDFESLSLLLIDDERFMRQVVLRVLSGLGVNQVREAADGSEGLKIVKEHSGDLDLVICDLEMPEMDGFAFVRRLRAMVGEVSKLPVLILTGHNEEKSVRDAVELGIDGYLLKPVSGKDLEQKINEAILSPMIDPDSLKD